MKIEEKPLISIVVPVYNTKDFLEKCLTSIVNQTYKNLEILLVNDGSTDGSGEICNRFAESDQRVKVLHQQNSGAAVAVKNGVEAASGVFLGFVDSDDYIAPDMYEKLFAAAARHDADFVQCNYVNVFENGKTEEVHFALEPLVFLEDKEIKNLVKDMLQEKQDRAKGVIAFSRCTKLIKSEVVRQNLVYVRDGVKMAEDLNLIFAVLADCRRVVLLPDYLYFYFQRAGSATKGFKPSLESDYAAVLEALITIIDQKNLGQDFYKALEHRKYANTLTLMRNTCRSALSRKEKIREIKRLHKLSSRVKLHRKGIKKRLQKFFFEAMLFCRLYRLITLTVR